MLSHIINNVTLHRLGYFKKMTVTSITTKKIKIPILRNQEFQFRIHLAITLIPLYLNEIIFFCPCRLGQCILEITAAINLINVLTEAKKIILLHLAQFFFSIRGQTICISKEFVYYWGQLYCVSRDLFRIQQNYF